MHAGSSAKQSDRDKGVRNSRQPVRNPTLTLKAMNSLPFRDRNSIKAMQTNRAVANVSAARAGKARVVKADKVVKAAVAAARAGKEGKVAREDSADRARWYGSSPATRPSSRALFGRVLPTDESRK